MPEQHYLWGTWTFGRHIDDRYGKQTLTATGTLTIDNNLWAEQGTMDGNAMSQNYHLIFNDHDGQKGVTVNFPDGRLFYHLTTPTQNQTIDHLCGDDSYQGDYMYHNANHFTLIWTVNGPKKDYTMTTDYHRITTTP